MTDLMQSDLVRELIEEAAAFDSPRFPDDDGSKLARLFLKAADEIERLHRENERMREALDGIAKALPIGANEDLRTWYNLAQACKQTARSALSNGEG